MQWIERELEHFNEALEEALKILEKREPKNLYAPVIYTLNMGGKRIRPVLLLLAHSIYSTEYQQALSAALAIEIFHNFTLLHDDMMDNASLRRNRKAVHVEYSNNTAILSGDAMSIISYEYLANLKHPNFAQIISLFTQTALEICEGQQFDMDFEQRNDVTIPEYLKMIQLKTAVLLGCSLKMGALIAQAPNNEAEALYRFGINLGLAFQLQDDYLDSFGNEKTFGKAIGGDITANKKTFLMLKALENAKDDQLTELQHWLSSESFDRQEKIDAVIKLYTELQVAKATKEKMDAFYQQALNEISIIKPERLEPLLKIAATLMDRNV